MPPPPTDYELAVHWAPTFYADTKNNDQCVGGGYRCDLITKVNYDGDWWAANNWDNLKPGGAGWDYAALKPYVYYYVVKNSTHTFLYYAVYHPVDWCDQPGPLCSGHESDMEGAVVIVANTGGDYGTFKGVWVRSHLDLLLYLSGVAANTCVRSDLDSCSGTLATTPGGSPGSPPGTAAEGGLLPYISSTDIGGQTTHWDGTHVKLYIESEGHGLCLRGNSPFVSGANRCGDNRTDETFAGENGKIYKVTTGEPSTPTGADVETLNYALIDITNSDTTSNGTGGLWSKRNTHSCNATCGDPTPASCSSSSGDVCTFVGTFSYQGANYPVSFDGDGEQEEAPGGPIWSWVDHNDGTTQGVLGFRPAQLLADHTNSLNDSPPSCYVSNPLLPSSVCQ